MAPTRRSGKRKREREREREKERKKERLVFYSSYTVCVSFIHNSLALDHCAVLGKKRKGKKISPT